VTPTPRLHIRPDEWKRKSRGRGRKASAYFATADASLTFVAIAEWMGVTEWGASKTSQAGRELYETDDSFQQIIRRIRAELS
jgi:hypothetical protein